jgi:hypothetical protein
VTTCGLRKRLYAEFVASHADTREAAYARVQLQNIVHAVILTEELLEVQVELARARLSGGNPPNDR